MVVMKNFELRSLKIIDLFLLCDSGEKSARISFLIKRPKKKSFEPGTSQNHLGGRRTYSKKQAKKEKPIMSD